MLTPDTVTVTFSRGEYEVVLQVIGAEAEFARRLPWMPVLDTEDLLAARDRLVAATRPATPAPAEV